MRYIFAFVVFGLLATWSVLVHSYIRSGNDILKYEDFLKDYLPLKQMSIDSNKGWKVLSIFYPEKLNKALLQAGTNNKPVSIDPKQINHLVEIYLRSHSLAACGHKECHETIGTFCSISKGTEFHLFFEKIVKAMYRQKALDSKTLLYLLETEPSDWSVDEPYFFMKNKIARSTVTVTDQDVDTKRQELIEEGFQTAKYWSYKDVRRAIINSADGETLEEIDASLGLLRGEFKMTFSNCFVRPVYLLSNCNNPVYEGRLDGLVDFIAENINRDLGVSQINELRAALPASQVQIPVVAGNSGVDKAVSKTKVISKTNITKPQEQQVFSKPASSVVLIKDVEKNSQVAPPKKSFAKAYGGSRFKMNWGN